MKWRGANETDSLEPDGSYGNVCVAFKSFEMVRSHLMLSNPF